MKRRIITIDKEKCNGCGLCAEACHEGAIAMVEGKAALIRDDYCDGLGDCLPACPTGAISFEEREALPYDDDAVKAHKEQLGKGHHAPISAGCPGIRAQAIDRREEANPKGNAAPEKKESQLRQWPVQIKLAPVNASYFDGAHLLIAADCTAYAYANFHQDFMKNKITLIGCPKLDAGDYAEKLTEILARNSIRSVTVARMEVPCCGGLSNAAITALKNCAKMIPWNVITISTDGKIIEEA